ncbi:MAG: hypothetical protein IT481_07120 [Gammaproteobacteria bacterium]|nr:hypothetical protein [Gammaproteobacteria bacterium]
MRIVIALSLWACGAVAAAAEPSCDRCGQVTAIRTSTTTQAWTPLGSMPSSADRLAPGQVNTQYNFTTGKMVLVGAAGGAGYARRSNSYEQTRWEVRVRMDDGSDRTITVDYEPAFREGERVRVYGRQIELAQ